LLKILWIGMGGFCGANLRYLVQTLSADRWGSTFPYGTLIANVTGSLILGFIVTLTTQRVALSPNWRLFLTVGLLGGYTTFSSFTVETLSLIETGRWHASSVYLLGSVLLGLAGAYLGIVLARAL
jgi:fluoride exporter